MAVTSLKVAEVNVREGLRVGLIQSYDNTLESSLTICLEFPSLCLNDQDVESGDLNKYHTILVDIRAYLVREVIKKENPRFLAYARAGGNLIIMYQRETEWKPEYAPYPFHSPDNA